VGPADLRRFVAVHGGHAEYMAKVWSEIADSVQARYVRSGAASRDSVAALGPAATSPPAGLPAERPGIPAPQPGTPGPRPPLVQPPVTAGPAVPQPPPPTLEHPPATSPPRHRVKPGAPHPPPAPRPGDTLAHPG
jgi:translation initiation factor IF-2